MKRTRKWEFVKQEAKRLAALGLSGYAIAKQLGVNEGSVSRWVKAGKLTLGNRARAARAEAVRLSGERQTPEEWAETVRASYDLDASDDQLVTLATIALSKGLNGDLHGMTQFRGLVKQLALVARAAHEAPAEPKRKVAVQERSGRDPRALLAAVK